MHEQEEVSVSLRRRARGLRTHAWLMFGLVIFLLGCSVLVFFFAGHIAQTDLARGGSRVTSQQLEQQISDIEERAKARRDRIKELLAISVPAELDATEKRVRAAEKEFYDLTSKVESEIEEQQTLISAEKLPVEPHTVSHNLDKLYGQQYGITDKNETYVSAYPVSYFHVDQNDSEYDINGKLINSFEKGLLVFKCIKNHADLSFDPTFDTFMLTPAEIESYLRKHKGEFQRIGDNHRKYLSSYSDISREVCRLQDAAIQSKKSQIDALMAEHNADVKAVSDLYKGLNLVREIEFKSRFVPEGLAVTHEISPSPVNLALLIQTNITRFGPLIVILFFAHIVFSMYKYSIRLAGHYDARADALELLAKVADPSRLEVLTKTLSPDAYDFGNAPKAPTDIVVEALANLGKKKVG
jgi:hypothetical protein